MVSFLSSYCCEIVLNSCLNSGDVQSGLSSANSLLTEGGIGVGVGATCG